MEKKRKVKSLLPRKSSVNGGFIAILLLILSVILCLGSASLMTASVGAASNGYVDSNNVYTGYDDSVEVLYRLEFLDPVLLWNGEVKENFYIENSSLYVTPNRVNVTGADNIGSGNFLGGSDNEVDYDNITMIAGSNNKIEWYNNMVPDNRHENASLLGGNSNKVGGDSNLNGAPAVVVGGKKNEIETVSADMILGGSGNLLYRSANSAILGGEGNEISHGDGVIIGGKNVKPDVGDIFAFSNSNSDFEPKTPNAFYLNLTNGLGINADSEKTGMAISGAVGFGSVDGKFCNANNVGVEGILNIGGYGCLVGCTEVSKTYGKWELLDRGESCEEKCGNNSYCMIGSDIPLEGSQTYTAFCLGDIPEGAKLCTPQEWESYENVVFQTISVDSEADCDKVGDNKCAYYCELGDENCNVIDEPTNEPTNEPETHCKGNLPSGATKVSGWKDGNVERTYYEKVNDGKTCAYECIGGYEWDGNKCEPVVHVCNTGGVWKPDNSDYKIEFVRTLKDCDWKCNPGYTQSGDSCILNKCVGDDPLNAYFLTGSDEGLSVPTQKQVIKHSQVDDGKECAYLCESGYVAVLGDIGGGNVGYMCDQCEPGTYDANNPDVCVRVQNCPEGYVRDSSLGSGCYLKGVCRYSNGLEYTGRSFGSIVGNYGDMEPISTQDFYFKCRDNDKYRGEVEPHTCTFECQEGSYCNGNAKCEVPKCRSYLDGQKDEIDGKDYYYRAIGHPGHYDFVAGYSNMIFGTGVTTSGEFFQKYGNKTGCYYWCASENRYYRGGVLAWRCGSTSTALKYQYTCGNLYLYGYGVSTGHAEVNKQGWVYTGDYNAVLNRKGSCIWSCEPGSQVMHGIRMTQKGEEERFGYPGRLFITGSSGKICYKNCLKDGKYMGNDGKCYSCQQGFKLDEESLGISVLSGKEYKEYRGCVPDCPEGAEWRYLQNKTYACVLKKVGGSCPEGYVSDSSSDGLCYMCLSTLETYVPGSGCVRKTPSD